MPKVSVIIPIYNVEKYIERCAVSLFEQTLDDIEYIFVNDCTHDCSMEILHKVLDRYPSRKPQVKIINMEKNSGIAAVRNKGLENVTGEYIIHCDSDDWAELDMYEMLYNKATETNSEIAVCNFIHEFADKSIKYKYPQINEPHKCITEHKRWLWWLVWDRIVHRDLIFKNNIKFNTSLKLNEDYCYIVMLYSKANRIEYIDKHLYHYNKTNTLSLTKITNKNELMNEHAKSINILERWFKNNNINSEILIYEKYRVKEALLNYNPINFKFWKNTYPEVNHLVINDRRYNWMYRNCYAMAAKGFFLPLKLYLKLNRLKSNKNA